MRYNFDPCRPKEFIDCISHVRLLSWLLLGSLTHTAISLQSGESGILSQPVPLDAGTHIADHVQVILGGFAEQSKASVLHMSSLFHAFILCQVGIISFSFLYWWKSDQFFQTVHTFLWSVFLIIL